MTVFSPTENRNLNLVEALRLYLRSWKLATRITLAFLVGAGLLYFILFKYQSTTRIIINDSQNNSLQALTQSVSGLNKSLIDGKKGNSLLAKHTEYLKSFDFYDLAAKSLAMDGNELQSSTRIGIDNDYTIRLTVYNRNKEQTFKIAERLTSLSLAQLLLREQQDVDQIQKQLETQSKQALRRFQESKRQLSKIAPMENLLSSKEANIKAGDYLTELRIRKQESQIELKENQKILKFLNLNKPKGRGAAPYGLSQKLKNLRSQNEVLKMRIKNFNDAISEWSNSNRDLPVNLESYDQLKKQAETDFRLHQELSDATARLEIYRSALPFRFELLDRPSIFRIGPKYSLWTFLALAFIFSQIVYTLWLYISYILKGEQEETLTNIRQAHTQDYYVDDPRFIIENGQLRFRADLLDGKDEVVGQIISSREHPDFTNKHP